jgi:hypothetical protein
MRTYQEFAGEREVLLFEDGLHSQEMVIHTTANGRQRDQTSQPDWLPREAGARILISQLFKEPYEWTDSVPEDNPKFQGLLEEEALFLDISVEIPGVPLEEEEEEYHVVTDKPKPGFEELAVAALNNAGINAEACVRDARAAMNAAAAAAAAAAMRPNGPCLVEAFEDEIVYNIMFDLSNLGLVPPGDNPEPEEPTTAPDNDTPPPSLCWYPTQSCRSMVGNQPYDAYAPQMQFLQLGEVQACMSALAASNEREINSAETMTKAQMHATMGCMELNDVEHESDKKMTMSDKHEVAVWAYLMTQYNLKPGLCKFGAKGEQAAMSELTQLHVIDTWTVMDPKN